MITGINLINYGRFRGREFEFGPLTVVYGNNEAGKTTLFDAIFEEVCSGAPARGEVWSRLSARYGEDREAKVRGEAPKFRDAVEFLELFAIRSGRINIEAEEGGSWAAAARNSLYGHGFNPAEIAARLEKRASTSNATRHQKHLNKLYAGLAETAAEIAGLEAQEAVVAGSRGALEKLESEISGLENKKAELDAATTAARARLGVYKKVHGLARVLRDRDFTAGFIGDEKKLSGLAAYRVEAVKEYDALAEKLKEAENALKEIGGTIKAGRETLGRVSADKLHLEGSLASARKEAELSEKLLSEVNGLAELKHGVVPPPAWVRYGIWLLCAACVAFGLFMAGQGPYGYALAVLSALAAAGSDFLLFGLKRRLAPGDEKARLAELYDKWANMGFNRAKIERATLAGVREALGNIKNVRLICEAAVESSARDLAAAIAGLEKLESRSRSFEEEKNAIAGAGRAWLAAAGAASRDDYLARALLRENLAAGLAKGESRLKELLEIERASTKEALLAVLDGRARELAAAGAVPDPGADSDINAEENRLQELSAEKQTLENTLNAKKIERENISVNFDKDLAKIPETLNERRLAAYELKEEIAENETLRAGAALAARIYRELEADSSVKFLGLAAQVRAMLARVLPQAEVNIGRIALGGVTMRDAGGVLRALEHLSSGTRDCFMLAARLALARSARGKEPGLLLLDDPFASLDHDRMRAALGLLKTFQAETGWQVMFFTKDKSLVSALESDKRVTVCKI